MRKEEIKTYVLKGIRLLFSQLFNDMGLPVPSVTLSLRNSFHSNVANTLPNEFRTTVRVFNSVVVVSIL